METTTAARTFTATSVVLDDATYVANGSLGIDSYAEFAETFKALGGVSCGIRPAWALPGAPACIMLIEGTTEAVAYVESVLV